MFGGIWGYMIGGIGLVGAAAGLFFYISALQADLELAENNVAVYKGQVESRERLIKQKNEDIGAIREINEGLNAEFEIIRNQNETLESRLSDFLRIETIPAPVIEGQPPGPNFIFNVPQVETRINIANKDMLRCNEIATGRRAFETDRENIICPELVESKL